MSFFANYLIIADWTAARWLPLTLSAVSVWYMAFSFDSIVSLLISSLSFALMWLAHSQREWTAARKRQSLRTGQNQRLLEGKSDRPIEHVTFIDLSAKDLLPLGQYRLFLGFRGSIRSKKVWFLTLTPSIHGCWNEENACGLMFLLRQPWKKHKL